MTIYIIMLIKTLGQIVADSARGPKKVLALIWEIIDQFIYAIVLISWGIGLWVVTKCEQYEQYYKRKQKCMHHASYIMHQ